MFKSKHYFLTIIFFLCYGFHALAQGPSYVWARGATGTTSAAMSEGFAIASDPLDNVFVTGYYSSPTTFGSITVSGGMPYLTKYDGSGNVKWVKDGTGRGFSRHVNTDRLGNGYVSGNIDTQTGVTFGPYNLTTIARADLYAVKYDASGNLKWALNTRGAAISQQESDGIAADASGNAYFVGDFNSKTLGIGTDSANTTSAYQIFIAKVDTSGNVIWTRSSSGNGVMQNPLTGNCVATDNSGNVYICGLMRSTSIKFGSITVTGSTGTNIFIAKYDSSGNAIWAKSALASNTFALATDTLDNSVYIAGAYSASAKFDTTTLTNAGANSYLAKYDTAGNVLWAKSINGPNTIYCIAPNNSKVYVSGKFTSLTSAAVSFDGIVIAQPAGSVDPAFFAGYSSTGTPFFARTLTSGGDDSNGIAASLQGCIYVGGDYQPDPFILGNDSLISAGHENAFVTKLCYSTVLLPNFTSSDDVFCGESGECIDFYDQSSGTPTSWKWSFPGATPDTSTQQNPTSICYYTPGTYAVKLVVSNGSITDSINVSPKITFAPPPAAPILTFSGDTVFCSHAAAYQWYFNGSQISGATDSFYVATTAGIYAVQIADDNGCTVLSSGYPLSVNELNATGGLEIYPNPASQSAVISLQSAVGGHAQITITNVLGEVVYRLPTADWKLPTVLNVSSLAKGIYIVELSNGDKVYRTKFVKE